jgi:hypothetical protein
MATGAVVVAAKRAAVAVCRNELAVISGTPPGNPEKESVPRGTARFGRKHGKDIMNTAPDYSLGIYSCRQVVGVVTASGSFPQEPDPA